MTGKLKKVLLPNLPYLLFARLFDKLCQAVRLSPGADASEKLLRLAQGFTEAFASLWLSLHPLGLLLGVAGAALARLAVYLKAKNAKKYPHITLLYHSVILYSRFRICQEPQGKKSSPTVLILFDMYFFCTDKQRSDMRLCFFRMNRNPPTIQRLPKPV